MRATMWRSALRVQRHTSNAHVNTLWSFKSKEQTPTVCLHLQEACKYSSQHPATTLFILSPSPGVHFWMHVLIYMSSYILGLSELIFSALILFIFFFFFFTCRTRAEFIQLTTLGDISFLYSENIHENILHISRASNVALYQKLSHSSHSNTHF